MQFPWIIILENDYQPFKIVSFVSSPFPILFKEQGSSLLTHGYVAARCKSSLSLCVYLPCSYRGQRVHCLQTRILTIISDSPLSKVTPDYSLESSMRSTKSQFYRGKMRCFLTRFLFQVWRVCAYLLYACFICLIYSKETLQLLLYIYCLV